MKPGGFAGRFDFLFDARKPEAIRRIRALEIAIELPEFAAHRKYTRRLSILPVATRIACTFCAKLFLRAASCAFLPGATCLF